MRKRGFNIEMPAVCNYESEPAWGKGREGCVAIRADDTKRKGYADKEDNSLGK